MLCTFSSGVWPVKGLSSTGGVGRGGYVLSLAISTLYLTTTTVLLTLHFRISERYKVRLATPDQQEFWGVHSCSVHGRKWLGTITQSAEVPLIGIDYK